MNEQLKTFLTEFADQCVKEADKRAGLAAERHRQGIDTADTRTVCITLLSLSAVIAKTLAAIRSKTGALDSLHEVARLHCSHIRDPYTLEEICSQISGGEYNAEMMLQHLMLWVSRNNASE
jgi:hypothetical protein